MKLAEIINRSIKSDLFNTIADQQLAEEVEKFYYNVLDITKNYAISNYELSTTLLYDLRYEYSILLQLVESIFPENSTVRKMLDEINLYLN